MIAVDTNLVVRLLTRDDEEQYQKSARIFQQNKVFIADTVLLETEWVLRYAYNFPPIDILRGLLKLLGLPNIQTSQPKNLKLALSWFAEGMDFADALHLAVSRHCTEMKTFDKAFIAKAKGLSACPVASP
jgi:predicted nucleic-acid-binding protein